MPSSSLPILKKGINSQGDTKSISLRVAAYVFDKFGNVAVDSEILKAANAVCKSAKTEPIISVDFVPAAALVLRSNALNGEKIDYDLYSTLSTKDTINREKIYSTYANEGLLSIQCRSKTLQLHIFG
uniref:Uncharacterized protein n=1 Tax=Panagrolaimus superbus TaxID=310955 RepID=A0A914Y4E9_9BILA